MSLIGAQYRSTGLNGPSGISSQMYGNFIEHSTVCQYLLAVTTTQSCFRRLAFGCAGAQALYGIQLNGSPVL